MQQLTLTLVTGNRGKLEEWKRLVRPPFKLENVNVDIEELQSFDVDQIVEAKARAAYEKIGKPVIVDDVSAGLESLEGLPGPFVKYFEQRLGPDALYRLAGPSKRATIHCTIGYYDGAQLLLAHGHVDGKVVSTRGQKGFGFDAVFVPEGHHKTYAEMTGAEKDAVSHRGRAVRDLLTQLKEL